MSKVASVTLGVAPASRAVPNRRACRVTTSAHHGRSPARECELSQTLLQIASTATTISMSALLAFGAIDTEPAMAALSNPNTRFPRNGVAALRRAVPAINTDAGEIQGRLEEAAYLLRIPQRKPWGTMADDVKSSLNIVRDRRARLLETVPSGESKTAAEATIAEIDQLLTELGDIAGSQNVERFDNGVAMALDATVAASPPPCASPRA